MEEFKPKRKNTAQPAQNGQSAPHTRKPRTPKPQGENAANAQHKPRPRRPRPAAFFLKVCKSFPSGANSSFLTSKVAPWL